MWLNYKPMKKITSIASFLLISFCLSAQSAQFLNLTPDAYTLGMAGASIALDANAFALYNNPAAMALSGNKLAVAASYGLWMPSAGDGKLFSASGFGKITDKAAIGISGRFITHLPYDITNDRGVVTSSYTPREYAIEAGAAYKIWRFSLGVAFRFIGSDMGAEKPGAAFGADLALMYKTKTLSLAAAISNIGTKISYGDSVSYTLPMMLKIGGAYNIRFLENHRISLGVEGDYLFNKGFMLGVGTEYSFKEYGFFRLGYHYGDREKAVPSYASIGLGGKIKGVSLNAAYLIAFGSSPMKNTLSLSLGYEF